MRPLKPIASLLLSIVVCLLFTGRLFAQMERAPAYPLITHNPYFSVWSPTDSLNASTTTHWSSFKQPLTGMIEVDGTIYSFLGQPAVRPYTNLLAAADEQMYTCPYTFTTPATGWQNAGFNDSAWAIGKGVFSNNTGKETTWNTPDIWIRRKFTLSAANTHKLLLKLFHDDVVEVYLNGVQVYSNGGYNATYEYFPIENHLVKGENVLAVHCHNNIGGADLDVGLLDTEVPPPGYSPVKKALQNSVSVAATQTHYNFTCGAVNLDVNFVSPLFLDDLKMVGRPVSYIQYKANATDNKTHNVKVYFGVSGELAKNQEEEVLSCSKFTHKDIDVLKAGTVNQPVLQTSPETINWGYLYVAVPKKFGAMQLTTGTLQINPFAVTNNALEVQQAARVWLNTIIPFGTVGQQPVERYVEVGYDNPAPIQYFSQNLRPWWNTDGTKLFQDELLQASIDYTEILKKADAFDKSLYADAVKAGGENYAKLCALAYRQSIAAHELVKGPAGELLFLSKENSSGGFINTVDVSYPAFPMYLIYNPQLVEGMLNGIFYYCESNKFKDKFAPHDIGSYPKANGQTYFLPMPIEETGNMILMVAAMEKSLGNVDYAKKHWPMLTKWVDYLVSMGYDPPSQLTSDDFAGIIAHSSNLSAKSINAIAAYAGMARAIGDNAAFQKYYTIAKQMAPKWMAAGDAGDHYKLAFDQPNTWSQKYNIIWDKLLGLNLFPKSVYEKEVKYYLTKQNAFGLPLDNRQTYTKSDWLIWTAIMADSQANFKALTDPVYKFSFQSDSNLPVSDMYQTTTGKRYQFHARSVVGGFFIKMLEQNWLQSDCGVPVSLSADNITANQATVHWMAGNKALGVKIQGKAAGSTNWVTFETAPSSAGHIITGLAPGTKYQWKIASICQNEPLILSDYSAVQEFTTLSKPAVTNGFNISLSPNPVQSTAKLAISNAKGDVTVQLLSLWGKLLWKNNIGKINTLDIPVSNLTQGTYIVTVTDGIEVKTTKLLKVN